MRTSFFWALRSSFAVSLSIFAVGCGASVGDGDIGSTDSPIVKCGESSHGAVQGDDVSEFQGDFSFGGRHLDFGYARVSYGDSLIDPTFSEDWGHMKSDGLRRGAYQYFRPSESVAAQAAIMIAKVGRLGRKDLPSVVDVEVTEGKSEATIGAEVREWLELVEAGTGRKPIVYTYSSFFGANVGLGSYPLWIADYGASCPKLPPGWSEWTMWQYSDGGEHLDHDVFNGSLTHLENLAGEHSITGLADKCIDVRDGDTANGTHIQLSTCNGTTSQAWTVGSHETLSALGKCMDATHSGDANGTKIQLFTCNGTGAQVWKHQSDGALLNPESGKCLDVPHADAANGTQLELYTCKTNDNSNQVWHLP